MNEKFWTVVFAWAALWNWVGAGTVQKINDEQTGWQVYELRQEETVVRVIPEAGCNAYSWQVRGVELFHTPEQLADVAGFGYGNPVLYPTPNRVRDARLRLGDLDLEFSPNNGPNFLHGLVHSAAWSVVATSQDEQSASLECELAFEPGTEAYRWFPLAHKLRLKVEVRSQSVRWTYTVDNSAGAKPVPFGFALHPYFRYLNGRAETEITIPATHLMESVDLLPTGKLLPLEGSEFDARTGKSLRGFVADDVYFGLQPKHPARIEFHERGIGIVLTASEDFTHMVVYTPPGRPFFCMENQTCSTDAHNLYARGLERESHLLFAAAGESVSGFVEYACRFPTD